MSAPDVQRPDVQRPARILLTGADGFVGRHLQAALARAIPEAIVLTAPFDLCDAAAVAAAVAGARPDVCVHLAAIATLAAARHDEAHAWNVNLHGTLRLAQAILAHAPHCRMLFVSSADAYGGGDPSGAAIGEATPLAPRNLYAATKAAADLALGALAGQGLQVLRLRPFNHTGPGQSADLVIAAFARQIARIEAGLQAPVLEVGNLDAWRDFLDVRDVCAAYVAGIARGATLEPGLVINIGSGQARRIGDVLADLLALAGVRAEIHATAGLTRPQDTAHAGADLSRAGTRLGWKPAIPWAQTLADVLDDWRRRAQAETRR